MLIIDTISAPLQWGKVTSIPFPTQSPSLHHHPTTTTIMGSSRMEPVLNPLYDTNGLMSPQRCVCAENRIALLCIDRDQSKDCIIK